MTDTQFIVLMATICLWGILIMARLGDIVKRLPPRA